MQWIDGRWRWLLMLGAVLMQEAARSTAPASPSGGSAPILVLSQLPELSDRTVMLTLRREIQTGAGTPPEIERIALPTSEENQATLQGLVREILSRRPWRLVVATTAQSAQLVAQAGTPIPLLFRSSVHPLINCLVRDMRHPGTPATGYTSATWSEGKMAEALQLAYPQMRQVVMLVDGRPEPTEGDCPPPAPTPRCRAGFVESADERDALLRGFTSLANVLRAGRPPHPPIKLLRLCDSGDIASLGKWLPANPSGEAWTGLVVPYQQLMYDFGPELIDQLRRLRLPAIFGARHFLPMGALMAMAPVAEPPGEARGIELAGRILAGESPADIPVQRPEGVELIVNINVARRMGLPPSKAALRAADRLIR